MTLKCPSRALTIFVLAALLLSCDRPANTDIGPPPSDRFVTGPGVVRGKISFPGTPPVMKELKNDQCCEGAKPLKEETVVVGPDKGLANCFVWIEGIGPAAPKGEGPSIDQVFCQYIPHAVGVAVGQKLTVKSSDPIPHNVNFKGKANSQINFGMTGAGQSKRISFGKAEIMPLKCDVHPWMSSYVGVFENSYFAVTRPDGLFEIREIPEGSYKLIVWHELYGQKEQAITIGKDAVEVNFEYAR
jgi:plastocyanin